MAGHSKFKNIMHRKGAQDKKRAGMFSKLSREITVAAKSGMPDPDKVFEAALDAGAQDVSSSDDGHEIWTEIADLHEVAKALEPVLGDYEGAKLAWRPQVMVDVNESDAGTLLKLIDALDEDDDVQQVWGNYEVSDDVLERLS